MQLDQLTSKNLSQAIETYCHYAHGSDRPEHIPTVSGSLSSNELLDLMQDESKTETDEPHRRYVFRLGSRDYPYMKLVLEECFYAGEFFFLVDTHDEIDLDPRSPDYQAWLSLRTINRRTKEAVENAWFEDGLPTLHTLRERLIAEGGTQAAGSREEIVLIVEDTDAARETLCLAMAQHGFASLHACTEKEAIARAQVAQPDCIVVDAFVGGQQGRDICKVLKEKLVDFDTLVVLLTARSDLFRQDEGVDAYVMTPVDEGVLFRTIDHLLKQRNGA